MTGKRKRAGDSVSGASTPSAKDGSAKPLSAVAAARLKAQQMSAASAESLDALSSPVSDPAPSEVSEDEAQEERFPVTQQRNVQLCTWRYGKDYVSEESASEITVSLRKGVTITLIGIFDFVVLKGAVNINGANMEAKARVEKKPIVRRAYVPSTNPVSIIRGLDGTNEVRFMDCGDAMPLDRLSPLFVDVWNAKAGKSGSRSFALIAESDADPLHRPLTPEVVTEEWQRLIEEIAHVPTSTLISGGTSTGKSTFARRLLNRYLTGLGKIAKPVPSVFFLDLDPNRPTYTPHGQISLALVREIDLGPEFTHPWPAPHAEGQKQNEIIRSHPMPVYGTLNYTAHFLDCANELIRTYSLHRQCHPNAPIIINTPGWLYTTHFSTLLTLLDRLKPSRVIHLNTPALTPAEEETTQTKFSALTTAGLKTNTSISTIQAVAPQAPAQRSDADLRAMQMLSYFHSQFPSSESYHSFNTTPLTHLTPWEFTYTTTPTTAQSLHAIISLGDTPTPSHLLTTLTGSLVQIITTTSSLAPVSRTAKYRIPYLAPNPETGAAAIPEPRTSKLVCTALVRGWDPERSVVQVLVPPICDTAMETLQGATEEKGEKTVFVLGCCDAPGWAYGEEGYWRAQGGEVKKSAEEVQPWVMEKSAYEGMGYLNTARRVRKYL